MNTFKITPDKMEIIARTFNTTPETVNKMYSLYKEISEDMRCQYLAHNIRIFEKTIKERLKFDYTLYF